MTVHKPSQADAAHIAIGEYARAQKVVNARTAELKAARLAKEHAEGAEPDPKRKVRGKARRKTNGLARWS